MATLKINTRQLKSVVICGEFCGWDIDKAMCVDKKNTQYIEVKNMPVGEYKVFTCKNFTSAEVYPSGRPMGNRYFSGEHTDIIDVYFEEIMEAKHG